MYTSLPFPREMYHMKQFLRKSAMINVIFLFSRSSNCPRVKIRERETQQDVMYRDNCMLRECSRRKPTWFRKIRDERLQWSCDISCKPKLAGYRALDIIKFIFREAIYLKKIANRYTCRLIFIRCVSRNAS